MEYKLAYITTGSADEAREIGRILVEERLAACVNILPEMISMFWWEGQVDHDSEAILLAKTTADKAEALQEKVVQLHSYDVPCVVFFNIGAGHAPFLHFIQNETHPA